MKKFRSYEQRNFAMRGIRETLDSFLSKHNGGVNLHLARLWEHWDMVMGEELAALATPLGHNKKTLCLGAEDTMAAQDLSMYTQEILQRVNAFMTENFFDKVQVELTLRRTNLSRIPRKRTLRVPPPPLPRPPQLGNLMGVLDPDSVVGQCYEAYVNYFKRLDSNFLK